MQRNEKRLHVTYIASTHCWPLGVLCVCVCVNKKNVCIFAPLSVLRVCDCMQKPSAFCVYKQWTSWFIEINRWPFIFSKYPKRTRLPAFFFLLLALFFELPPLPTLLPLPLLLLRQTFLLKTEFMCVYILAATAAAATTVERCNDEKDNTIHGMYFARAVYTWVRRQPHIRHRTKYKQIQIDSCRSKRFLLFPLFFAFFVSPVQNMSFGWPPLAWAIASLKSLMQFRYTCE